MLVGRRAELGRAEGLLEQARRSSSGVLVVRGDAGMGKSALLGAARQAAAGMQVLTAQGVEPESHLPFAGLHQLLRPGLGRLARLPAPQADELRSALGLARPRAAVDRFLVSVAVLSLLAEMAEQAPVLCVVDDAHWLDAASSEALVFVARRLSAEPIAMLFAVREPESGRFEAVGLPELRLAALDPAAGTELLSRQMDARVAPDVAARLVDATAGNPFALLEIGAALSLEELSGTRPLPVPLPLSSGLEEVVLRQVRRLPDPSRTLMLVAAADDTGQAGLVLRAAGGLGAGEDALGPAEAAGLIRVDQGRLEFRHPLVRSAVYRAAAFADRRSAHLALADAYGDDADRKTWHRAAAAYQPDPAVARELEGVAGRARRRGAYAAASLACERAAELAGEADRGRHLVSGAEDAWLAGQPARALELAGRARSEVGPALARDVDRLRGIIEYRCGRPAEAFRMLLIAATEPGIDPGTALDLLADASEAASIVGDAAGCAEAGRLARALALPGDHEAVLLRDLVVGMGHVFAGDPDAGVPLLAGVSASAGSMADPARLAWAGRAAWYIGDERAAGELFARSVRRPVSAAWSACCRSCSTAWPRPRSWPAGGQRHRRTTRRR